MKTLQDIKIRPAASYPLSNNWSLQNAIKDRVEQEDFLRWAQEDEERGIVGELESDPPTRLSLFTFIKGILP